MSGSVKDDTSDLQHLSEPDYPLRGVTAPYACMLNSFGQNVIETDPNT